MQGLATENAPSPGVVVPHFIFAAVSFLALSIMVLLSGDSFTGYFFQPHLLAITHVAALGWGTMIIFGALYQLIPVIFETSLYSEKLAHLTFWMYGAGIILMVFAFWTSDFTLLLPIAGVVVFTALLFFTFNVFLSFQKSEKKNIKSLFIGASAIWLLLTALLGFLIALNYRYNFLSQSHFLYLKMHAHMGIAGWFLLMVFGAASTLIPMFLISHQMNEKKLSYSFYFINAGLALLSLDWLILHGTQFLPVYGIIIVTGILFFLSYVHESYKKRLRKNLDFGMKHTMIAMLALFLPVVLGLAASQQFIGFEQTLLWKIIMLYGFSIFFMFITSIILGQTYKTIPFIIWLVVYTDMVGKAKTPLPKELYSEKLANWQLYVYLLAMLTMLTGIISGIKLIVEAGGLFLFVTAILYNINVFKIVFHKASINSEN